MSYIGLFNETYMSADNIIVTDFVCDTLAVNNSLISNGTSALNNTTLSGSLNGLTVVSDTDVVLTFNASTMTFTVSLNTGSIINTNFFKFIY